MTAMSKVQAEALTAFIVRVRTDWRPAGVLAALEKTAPTADVWDVARALLALAADDTIQTPGLLDKPGPHWRTADGIMPSRRGENDVHCHEHPLSVHPCPQCKAKRQPPPLEDPEYAAMRAELRARRPIPTVQKRLADFQKAKEQA